MISLFFFWQIGAHFALSSAGPSAITGVFNSICHKFFFRSDLGCEVATGHKQPFFSLFCYVAEVAIISRTL
jgi:hypothetical protein